MNTPNGYKIHYISQLVISAVAALFLLQTMIKNPNIFTRLMLTGLLLLVFVNVAKTVFMVLDKPQAAAICNKIYAAIFVLYWFGFLVVFSYMITLDGGYLPLISTIPFWIAGIYMIYRIFFKRIIQQRRDKKAEYNGVSYEEISHEEVPRASQSRSQVIVGGVLIGICLLAGALMLFFGIRGTYQLNRTTADYVVTDGYFSNYDVYNVDEENGTTTYRLIYTYTVDGVNYEAATDYGTGTVPKWGSMRKVKYNPSNPQESVLSGTNGTNGLIYMGAFFTMCAIIFILAVCTAKGWFDKAKFDVMGLGIGIILTIMGIGVFMLQNGEHNSLIETIRTMRFWIFVPIVFITIGLLMTIKSMRNKRKEEYPINREH